MTDPQSLFFNAISKLAIERGQTIAEVMEDERRRALEGLSFTEDCLLLSEAEDIVPFVECSADNTLILKKSSTMRAELIGAFEHAVSCRFCTTLISIHVPMAPEP